MKFFKKIVSVEYRCIFDKAKYYCVITLIIFIVDSVENTSSYIDVHLVGFMRVTYFASVEYVLCE